MCKHKRHVTIVEKYITETVHDVELDGAVISRVSDGRCGAYTGQIEVSCADCGRIYSFNRFTTPASAGRIPQWVKRSMGKAGLPIYTHATARLDLELGFLK